MRRALGLLGLLGLAACAPRIPPPDQLWESDENLAARVQKHAQNVEERGMTLAPSYIADLERTLAEIAQEYGAKSPAACQTLTDAGVMLLNNDHRQEALRYFERSLTVCEAVYGHEHRETSYSLHDYAVAQVRAAGDRYEPRARYGFEEALAVRRRILGDLHEETAAAEVSLGKHVLAGCRAEPPCSGADLRLERARGLARHAIKVFQSAKVPKVADQKHASNLLIDVVAQRGSAASDSSSR